MPATRLSSAPRPIAAMHIFVTGRATLDAIKALGPEKVVPGRGRSLVTREDVVSGIEGTASFTSDLFGIAKTGVGCRLGA